MMSEPAFKYCPMCATPLVEADIAHVRRPVCPACNFILFLDPKLVVVVVVQYLDKLLFARRNIEPGKGLWNFCGGYVDRGETVEDAAIREVKEESNLDIELGNLIGVYSEAGDSHIVIAYEAQIDEHQVDCLAAQPEEVGELAFFRWEELPTFAFPVHHRILQDLKRLKG